MPLRVIRREGQDDDGAEWLARAAPDLVCRAGDPLEFAPNPIQRVDPALARAFESTVREALRGEPEEPLVIRFGLWKGEDDDPRYVCKVESVADADAPPAWRWWSPLVRTPAELADHLQEAIRSRDRQPPTRATSEQQFWGWGPVGRAGA